MNILKSVSLIALSLLAVVSCACSEPVVYDVEVVAEYPHDTQSYTQGLFFDDGKLYESTGLKGKSTFRCVDLTTGKALKRMDFDKKYFLEGSVMFDGNLYILTWESRVAFVYDAATLEYKNTWKYPREGWGLTTEAVMRKLGLTFDRDSQYSKLDGSETFPAKTYRWERKK